MSNNVELIVNTRDDRLDNNTTSNDEDIFEDLFDTAIDDTITISEEKYIKLDLVPITANANIFEKCDMTLDTMTNKHGNHTNDDHDNNDIILNETKKGHHLEEINQFHANELMFNSSINVVNPLIIEKSQQNYSSRDTYDDNSMVSRRSLLAKKLIGKIVDFNSMEFEDFEYSIYKQTIITKNNQHKKKSNHNKFHKYQSEYTNKLIGNDATNNTQLSGICYGVTDVVNICDNSEYASLDKTSKPQESDDFNWTQYLINYPDLKQDGITTQEQALRHWRHYGKMEKRSYLPLKDSYKEADNFLVNDIDPKFDWTKYVNAYADLQQNNVNTKEKAWNHWVCHGKKEGRIYVTLKTDEMKLTNELDDFDWEKYVNAYADLQENNIKTKEQAWNHWVCHGKPEGRIYFAFKTDEMKLSNELDQFDWEKYVNAYADLQQGNINTKEKAWIHWISHGQKEGRGFHVLDEIDYENFNWEQYLYNYQDLVDSGIVNKESAWNHWKKLWKTGRESFP